MGTVLKKNKYFTFLLILLLSFSCSDSIVFSKYKTLENSEWNSNENIFFEFEVLDTLNPKNIFINLRNNSKYAYSNIYIISEMNFPNGTKIVDTLQYEMANNKGEFLGKGFANIKENKLFYKENKIFPELGTYSFKLRHAMRNNGETNSIPSLEGIQDGGLTIEKIK